MDCPFTVNQKVVCVLDLKTACAQAYLYIINRDIIPEVDKIYTIREIILTPDNNIAVRLKEITNKPWGPRTGYTEPVETAYDYRAFRALQERPKKADISIFNKIKDNISKNERDYYVADNHFLDVADEFIKEIEKENQNG